MCVIEPLLPPNTTGLMLDRGGGGGEHCLLCGIYRESHEPPWGGNLWAYDGLCNSCSGVPRKINSHPPQNCVRAFNRLLLLDNGPSQRQSLANRKSVRRCIWEGNSIYPSFAKHTTAECALIHIRRHARTHKKHKKKTRDRPTSQAHRQETTLFVQTLSKE